MVEVFDGHIARITLMWNADVFVEPFAEVGHLAALTTKGSRLGFVDQESFATSWTDDRRGIGRGGLAVGSH